MDLVSQGLSASSEVFLLVRQSKSRRLFLYGTGALAHSNANLTDEDSAVTDGGDNFVIPEGGLARGLAGRAVLITNKH